MSAAQPLAWALAALSIPVVLAYLHRRRRTPKLVASAILFRTLAGQAIPTKRTLARPHHLISLVLVLLALLAAITAVADLRRGVERPRDVVIVLDTSASMGVRESDGTRLDHAIDAIERAVSGLHPGDRLALVTTGEQTSVRIGLTEDHGRVVELARAQAPAGTSQGAWNALRIADALCRASDHGSIVLVSDGVGVAVPSTKCSVEHVPIGRPGPNVGVSALAVREADALGLGEVYLSVTSATGTPREVEVTLRAGDDVVDVFPLDLPARGETEKVHRIELPPVPSGGGAQLVTAELTRTGEDVLAADDVASVPREVGSRVSVVLVADTRLSFTAEALRLHPRVDLTVVGPNDAPRIETFDLAVLESEPRQGIPTAPKVVAFGVAPPTMALRARSEVADAQVIRWSFDHPLFRYVDLAGIQLPKTWVLTAESNEEALVDSDQGAIAIAARQPAHDLVYFGFAPHETDLVLRVGFVNLVANIVEWGAPATAKPTGERAGVLAATESTIDPPERLVGATHGDFARAAIDRWPIWQLLVMGALLLIALEHGLPLAVAGARAVAERVRAFRRRRRPLGGDA
jgi:hypothetical protein